jgi:hypothetical protein
VRILKAPAVDACQRGTVPARLVQLPAGYGHGRRLVQDRRVHAILNKAVKDKDESVNALVGGEPDEPVQAAGAGQSLELVLASVL